MSRPASVAAGTLREVFSLEAQGSDLDVLLAAVDAETDEPVFQRLNIATGLAADFRHVVADFLSPLREAVSERDMVIHTYEPGAKLDQHEIEAIDLSKYESIGRQIVGLSEGNTDLRLFDESEAFIAALRFYVVTVRGRKREPVHFFRIYTPKKELTRSKLFGVTLQKGQYDRYREHMYLFDDRFDCFSCNGVLYILNKGNFEKIFRFYELLAKTAHKTLRTIEETIPIENFAEFATACESHLQKLAKLKNIAAKSYFRKITVADLKRVISKYDLPIETVGRGKAERIVYDPRDKWAILRLLDDDYLESVMTRTSYEVNSKRPLGR